MKPSLGVFLEKFEDKDGQLGGDWRGLDENEIKAFKLLTQYIDYDCQFDEKGVCASRRNWGGDHRCCCDACGPALGYLRYIASRGDAEAIWKLWRPRKGFLTPMGCSLPRDLRSDTCLGHHCRLKIADQVEYMSELRNVISDGLEGVDFVYEKHFHKSKKRYEYGRQGCYYKIRDVYKRIRVGLLTSKRVNDMSSLTYKGETLHVRGMITDNLVNSFLGARGVELVGYTYHRRNMAYGRGDMILPCIGDVEVYGDEIGSRCGMEVR